MYQLHPGGAGGSYGAMFLDVLVPVCAWLCQIVCGQCLCLLWFSARRGLAGSWHPNTSPSIHWHRVVGGVSKMTQLEDGNVFWQALPGGVCLKLTFCPSSFSYSSTISPVTCCTGCSSLWLSVVETFALLYIPFLWASFSCLMWTLQHFASVQTRKDCFRPGTLIRVFRDRNILYKVGLSACIEMTGKYLDFHSGFLRCSPFTSFFFVWHLHLQL